MEWSGDTGYISYDYIKSKAPILSSSNFYFCGPPIMTDSIINSLIESGHKEELVHSEKFVSPASFDLDKVAPQKVKVIHNQQSYNYDGKDTILEFLEKENLDIPFACRSGVCGECKCMLIEGNVDSLTDSGLTASEKKDNYILTCVSRPTSDIKIKSL